MATPLCCLFNLPAECTKCGVRVSEGASADFIWVMDAGQSKQFCSAFCLIRHFIHRSAPPEVGG